jgi:NADH-quinone oxidoreductase subunit H
VLIQKAVMGLFGGLCLVLAGALGWALTASPGVLAGVHGAFWFMAKVLVYLYGFLWFRFTFPRYRFDQLMRLGWQFLIPLALVNVMAVGVALVLYRDQGWNLWAALGMTTVATLVVAAWLGAAEERHARIVEPMEQ